MTMHTCPRCGSQEFSRNGLTRHGKQNYKCRDCGRQLEVRMGSGFGWRSIVNRERLSGAKWVTGVRSRLKRYGSRCPRCIGNVQ
ncbi:transposase-like zinc-binding domain-containing protein [Alkalinema pantanalense CENA528]|uniref:transposase-like zinc-binding domain-containing protein n=1 Tax=Alkalinema pantanalense TaxID=1620705 RepID=UPI003D6F0049